MPKPKLDPMKCSYGITLSPDSTPTCTRDARMAISTKRPTRENLYSSVYYDDRTAPKTAQRYCKEHGSAVVSDLVKVLVAVDNDSEEADEPTTA